jgi:hypothetical protein
MLNWGLRRFEQAYAAAIVAVVALRIALQF